jgi:hypothetical protein
MRSVWSPGGAQDESPGRQPWGAAAPYPAPEGRHMAGAANSMGEGRSVPALTGRGSLRTDSLGASFGRYRLFHTPCDVERFRFKTC